MDQNLMLTPTPTAGLSPGMTPGVTDTLGETSIVGPITGISLLPPTQGELVLG